MSEIDERIVSLQFDNKSFKRDVADTIKVLDELERKLAFERVSDGFENVASGSDHATYRLKQMGTETETLQMKFSALEIIAITALSNITTAAMQWGVRAASAFWDPIVNGGKRRSQNIANARFQIEGLNADWDAVKKQVEFGVQDTAYGLDEAAKVASSLIASGTKVDDTMGHILRGISGVAAMTNATYSEIGDIYTTVASNGKLMTMQLRQLSARGLNVAAVLSKSLGKTEQEINSMVTKGQISFDQFAKAMDEAFGEHAKEANKTFTGALSNMRSALARIGELFATPVFDLGITVFNNLRDSINAVARALKLSTGEATENSAVGVWKQFIAHAGKLSDSLMKNKSFLAAIVDLVVDIWTWVRPIIFAMKEVFYISENAFWSVGIAMRESLVNLQLYGDAAVKVKDIFKALFNVIKLIGVVAFNAIKIVSPLIVGLAQILGVAIDGSDTLTSIINKTIPKLIRIANLIGAIGQIIVKDFLSGLVLLITPGRKVFSLFVGLLKVIAVILVVVIGSVMKLAQKALPLLLPILKAIATIGIGAGKTMISLLSFVMSMIPQMVNGVIGGVTKAVNALSSIFGGFSKSAKKSTDEIASSTEKIGRNRKMASGPKKHRDMGLDDAEESLDESVNFFDRMRRLLVGIGDGIKTAIAVILAGIKMGLDGVASTFVKVVDLLNKMADMVNHFWQEVIIGHDGEVISGAKAIAESRTSKNKTAFADALKEIYESNLNAFNKSTKGEVRKMAGRKPILEDVDAEITEEITESEVKVEEHAKRTTSLLEKIKTTLINIGNAIVTAMAIVAGGLYAGFITIKQIFVSVITFISNTFKSIITGVKDFITGLANFITGLDVIDILVFGLVSSIGMLLASVLSLIFNLSGAVLTASGVLLVNAFSGLIAGFTSVLKYASIFVAIVGTLYIVISSLPADAIEKGNSVFTHVVDEFIRFAKEIMYVALMLEVLMVVQSITKIITMFTAIKNKLNPFNSQRDSIAESIYALADVIKGINIAFGIFAGSLLAFTLLYENGYASSIDSALDTIKWMAVILGTTVAGLLIVSAICSRFSGVNGALEQANNGNALIKINKNTNALADTLKSFGIAFGVLTIAILTVSRQLSKDPDSVWQAVGVLTVIGLALTVFAGVIGLIARSIDKQSKGLEGSQGSSIGNFAEIIKSLASTIKSLLISITVFTLLAHYDLGSFIAATVAVGVLMTILGVMLVQIQRASKWGTNGVSDKMILKLSKVVSSLSTFLLSLAAIMIIIELIDFASWQWQKWAALGSIIIVLTGIMFWIKSLAKQSGNVSANLGGVVKALSSVALLILSIAGVMWIIDKIDFSSWSGGQIAALALIILTLVGVLAAITILANSVGNLNGMAEVVKQTCLLIGVVFAGILGLMIGLNYMENIDFKLLVAALAGAFAIIIAAGLGIAELAMIPAVQLTNITKLMLSIAALITGLGAVVALIAFTFGNADFSGSSILMMALSTVLLGVIAGILTWLAKTSISPMAVGTLGGIALVITSLGAVLTAIGLCFRDANFTGTSIGMVSAALAILGVVVAGLTFLAGVVAANPLSLGALGGIALMILAFGGVLTAIGLTFNNSNITPEVLKQINDTLLILGVMTAIVTGVAALAGLVPMSIVVIIGMAALVAAFALAMSVFTPAWNKLMSTDTSNMWNIIAGLTAFALVLGLLGIGGTIAAVAIALISGALALLGVVIREFGDELEPVAEAFASWVDAMVEAFKPFAESVANTLNDLQGIRNFTVGQGLFGGGRRHQNADQFGSSTNTAIDKAKEQDANTRVTPEWYRRMYADNQNQAAYEGGLDRHAGTGAISSDYFNSEIANLNLIHRNTTALLGTVADDISKTTPSFSKSGTNMGTALRNGFEGTIPAITLSAQRIGNVIAGTFGNISGGLVGAITSITSMKSSLTNLKLPTVTSAPEKKAGVSIKGIHQNQNGDWVSSTTSSDSGDKKKDETPSRFEEMFNKGSSMLSSFTQTVTDASNKAIDYIDENTGWGIRDKLDSVTDFVGNITSGFSLDSITDELKGMLPEELQSIADMFTSDDLDIGSFFDQIDTSAIEFPMSKFGSADLGWGDSSSGMASNIASSKALKDSSKDKTSDAFSTTNNYFTQNNYSPEPLARSEIYKQTQRQLNQWGGWVRQNNA